MNAADVAHALQTVYDPELGIDIVSLGLVYSVDVEPRHISVALTTTTPSCPMGPAIFGMAKSVLEAEFAGATIELTFADEPRWQIGMANAAALRWLGMAPA